MMLKGSRRRRRDIVCIEFVEVVTDYMEGTMAPPDRRRLERHLAACPHCTRYLVQLRSVVDMAGRLTTDDVHALGPAARTELLAAYRAFRDGR
jgi:anti-sigma factor RsiW